MLKHFNLFVIDKIFTVEAATRISAASKSLYVNCLIHHFKDKKPIATETVSFKIYIAEIPKYETFKLFFEELQLAKLVVISELEITFLSVWRNYLDKSITKMDANVYVGAVSKPSIKEFVDVLKTAHELHELIQSKYSINNKKCLALLDIFLKEQIALNKTYNDKDDCFKHFLYWTQYNLNRLSDEKKLVGNNKMYERYGDKE